MRILILYFSGAGSSKTVADLYHDFLEEGHMVTSCAAEDAVSLEPEDYDAFVIGTPVYHGAPSRLITTYFENIPPLRRVRPAFIYNTHALWSCNTNRLLSIKIKEKNIVTIMDRDYRSPASDGSLIMPYIKRFFEFENKLQEKIKKDSQLFISKLNNGESGYIPRFRLSSILNAPNKLAGQRTTFKIYLHPANCIRCKVCIENCPHQAIRGGDAGYPMIEIEKCENCYRCIHHCDYKALSLSKKHIPKKLLVFDK